MSRWNTDKIIGAGLIVALIFYFVVITVVAVVNDTLLPLDVASNIVTGLAGYMGRSLLEKPRPNDDKSKNEN